MIGLDGGSTSSQGGAHRREREHPQEGLPALEGQPDPGHEGASSRSLDDVGRPTRARRSRCIGFGATGYAADVLEESRASADVNIVETVAHMMSAAHFFGDVDVICDIGGQDIKVLFMQNGDIKNFRLSNQCSAGNGMLLQAMADQFGVPVTEYAETAFEAELAPKFSYGCAVFLDTDRVNFQKEGYSKEELLAGPRAGAAEERLAVRRADPAPGLARHASSCCRAARSTTWPRVKAQVDYIKERVPDAEVYVHPHTRRGRRDRRRVRDAARGQAPRARRRFIGIDAAIDLEYTTKNDEETRCHFCPNECTRTFIDTEDARRRDAPATSPASPARRARSRSKEAMLALVAERKKTARSSSRTWSTTRRSCAFRHFYDAAPHARGRHADQGRRGQEDASSAQRRVEIDAAVPALARPRRRRRAAACASASRACSTSTRRRRSCAPTSRRSASRSRTSSSPTRPPRRCGSRAASTARSIPCYPSKVAQAHIHNLLFHHHSDEEAAQLHLLPDPHARPVVRRRTRWTTRRCPIVAGAPNVHEGGLHQGGRLLRRARHQVPRPGAARFTEPTLLRSSMFERLGPAPRHHRGRERLRRATRRWKALDDVRRRDLQEQGPRDPRDGRGARTASRS